MVIVVAYKHSAPLNLNAVGCSLGRATQSAPSVDDRSFVSEFDTVNPLVGLWTESYATIRSLKTKSE